MDVSLSRFSETLLVLGVVLARLLPSANRLSVSWASVVGNRSALEELLPDISSPPKPLPVTKDNRSLKFENKITLRDAVYCYPSSAKAALTGVDFSIQRNTSIGIVGASGAGKTTFLELIAGLIFPQRGSVFIDETPLTPSNAAGWLPKIGYVPQSTYLLEGSVRDNIVFGRELNNSTLEKVIRLARLETFIKSLPEGVDSFVGESGNLLSGGQRQRIGIARALYGQPELLILDEVTSALDVRTERELQKEISSLKGSVTLVAVSHRLDFLNNCDQVIILDNGEIIKKGDYVNCRKYMDGH
ncbi:ABC-type multidrug transport system [Magnetospirillum fulvum MGU-K5]|uniref:ABC-type multidrug transport system n=2 Tax=Magnetospirillum fulvum TaxID=1082 RepID=S9S778_MAGFU|nr:ABC-type multidrug transport system [Magnetospirillum fulvum MGU-K5]